MTRSNKQRLEATHGKILMTAAATAVVLLGAGAALAQDQSVVVEGTAPAICSLPNSWAFVSGAAGASGGTFSGTTWTIPEGVLAGPESFATTGGEYAIRIRGAGFCNTSHTINLRSQNGGLVAGDPTTPPPGGFAKRRALTYEAYWSDGGAGASTVRFGPRAIMTATTPAQEANASYVVSGSLAPPGHRAFDLRIGMNRGALAAPLIAGDYTDTVIVTLSPTS